VTVDDRHLPPARLVTLPYAPKFTRACSQLPPHAGLGAGEMSQLDFALSAALRTRRPGNLEDVQRTTTADFHQMV
jgi:hypothetical protein